MATWNTMDTADKLEWLKARVEEIQAALRTTASAHLTSRHLEELKARIDALTQEIEGLKKHQSSQKNP